MRLINKISPKKLRDLYWKRKMSLRKIAKICQCYQATIWGKFKKYGIKRRTNSASRKLVFKVNASKDELEKLYSKRKLSSPEIAKIYHCTPGTVRRILRKYGIRVRTKSESQKLFYNINIPKQELKKLYLEKKVSSVKIAKEFKCNPGLIRNRLREYKIPIRSIQEALPLSNTPKYPRSDFSGNLEEKAYLIGFRLGDLHAYHARSRTIVVAVASSKRSQIELFEKLFSEYGHIWKGKIRVVKGKRVLPLCCYLNNTFNFLIRKKDLIEPWILKNTKYFAAFLAGYSDAEGSFCLYNGRDGVFNIRSQDKNILRQLQAKLIKLGILCRPPQIARKKGTKDIRGTISNDDIWGLWIYRKDALLKLIDLLHPYSKHADKRKGMEIVKNNVLERNEKYHNQQDRRFYKLYLKEGVKI